MISVKLNDPKVTPQTIRNYLKRMEIRKVVPKRIPMITKVSIAKRLSWCKENIGRNWKKVIFSDENKFKQFQINKKQ